MGVGNLLGQPFYKYLNKQVEIRQEVHGSGFTGNNANSDRRSSAFQQYLNSKTSWVKLASSVIVDDRTETEITGSEGQESIYVNEGGLRFLKKLELPNQYKGVNLARESVLFSGLQGTGDIIPVQEQTVTQNGEEVTLRNANAFAGGSTNFIPRSGISKTTSVWNLASAYGLGGLDFGQQPMPGITDVNIKSLNRGSLRRAEISIKANNRYQFELIETLYLRLGYTMLLEWGNSHYLPNEGGTVVQDPTTGTKTRIPEIETIKNTYIEDKWFSQNGKSTNEILADIEKLRENYSGNYDAFFGKVVNFNWKFNPDGTYDIMLSLVSMGDIVESLKFNALYHPKDGSPVNEDDDISDISNYLNSIKLKTNVFNTNKGGGEYVSLIDPDIQYREIEDDVNDTERKAYQFTNQISLQQNKYGYYWRFGDFLAWVQKHLIPTYTSGNEEFKQIRIDADEVNNVMCAYPNQFSIDPRVCIVRTNYGNKLQFKTDPYWYKYMVEWCNPNFPTRENEKVPPHGRIMNIYINFNEIITIVNSNKNKKGDVDFYSFFSKLLDNINKALGGINNLELIVEEDSNTIKIIDQNVVPGSAVDKQSGVNFYNKFIKNPRIADKSTKLEIFGYGQRSGSYTSNFVKDFSFETKIDKNLANTISISAAAGGGFVGEDATAFSSWSQGLSDKYKQYVNAPEAANIPTGSGFSENPYYKTNVFTYYELGAGYTTLKTVKNQSFDSSGNIVENEEYDPDVIGDEVGMTSVRAGTSTRTIRAYTGTEYFLTQAGHDKIAQIVENVYNRNIGYFITECFGSNVTGNTIPKIVTDTNKDKANVLSNLVESEPQQTIETIVEDGGRYLQYSPSIINRGESSMKNYFLTMGKAHYRITRRPTGTGGFIPLDLGITVDGISGVKIYNSVNVDTSFLPSTYGDDLDFIVRGVGHKLSNGEWSTDIDCLSIPRPTEEIYEVDETPLTISSSVVENNDYGLPYQIATPINGYRQGENLYVIRMDKDGSGLFGSPRVGGKQHKGLDFLVQEDATVRAPFEGIITLSGPSVNTPNLKGVKIKGEGAYEGYECKMFYFLPNDDITNGTKVFPFQSLGKAQQITGEGKYNLSSNEFMQNHIHFELYYYGELVTLQSSVDNEGTKTELRESIWAHSSPGRNADGAISQAKSAIFEIQEIGVATVSGGINEQEVKEKWTSEWRRIRSNFFTYILFSQTNPSDESLKTFLFIIYMIDKFIGSAFGGAAPELPIDGFADEVIKNTSSTTTDLGNTRDIQGNKEPLQKIKNFLIETYVINEGIDKDTSWVGKSQGSLFSFAGGINVVYFVSTKAFGGGVKYDRVLKNQTYDIAILNIWTYFWNNYSFSDPYAEERLQNYYKNKSWYKEYFQGQFDL
mgnify:CR=1 FL=1